MRGASGDEGQTSAMSTSVIIDVRDRLRWHQRFACEASTAALWGGWLWLWAPLLKAGGSRLDSAWTCPPGSRSCSPSPAREASRSRSWRWPGPRGRWWRGVPLRKASIAGRRQSPSTRGTSSSPSTIEAGRGAATCVVHHDSDGRIARIECRGVAQA